MDNVSKETRSRTMRAVRGRDTSPELALRRALWAAGERGYRLHPADLPGRPDFIWRRLRLAVFVDGCYWHGCPTHCRRPSSNVAYWHAKIARNVERDHRADAALAETGWRVLRLWEHELKRELPAAVQRIRDARRDRRTQSDEARRTATEAPAVTGP